MFDISFFQILVIALVALIVIGPERLPRVARVAGLMVGRVRRYTQDLKQEINREIELDELKRLQEEVAVSARNLEASLRSEMKSAEGALTDTMESARDALTDTIEEVRAPLPENEAAKEEETAEDVASVTVSEQLSQASTT